MPLASDQFNLRLRIVHVDTLSCVFLKFLEHLDNNHFGPINLSSKIDHVSQELPYCEHLDFRLLQRCTSIDNLLPNFLSLMHILLL